MNQLWKDDAAFVVSADLVLISSILVLGLLVGLVSLRDQIVQELADVGLAVGLLNQSYTWSAITGHTSVTEGSAMFDSTDVCDEDLDPAGFEPLCIYVTVDAEDFE